ncbi:MAG: hypothetical protein ABR498_06720 [Candidatus Dormibacteria bacterium]
MSKTTATAHVTLGIALAAGVAATIALPRTAHATGPITLGYAMALPSSDGGSEPRATVTPDGKHYAISNIGGTATVYESDDGLANWHATNAGGIAGQSIPTIDVDLVSMPAASAHPGRLIATELDTAGLNFRTSWSDDGGANWTTSTLAGAPNTDGSQYADQDRPWLATGPHDRVYMLMHNLASGTANHNMYVATSTDAGASFGPFIPLTTPGEQANTDLQCADSGGPSNLFVDQNNGQLYAVWGSRSSIVAGGCGASVTGSFEINVVAATRVWIATAPESGTALPAGAPGGWTQSLAVDDNAAAKIVGMQLAPGAIDSAGNVYILYPESPQSYPDYDGGAIKYVHATESDIIANPYGITGPSKQIWSSPVTVAPGGGAGNLLPHIVAGGPGQIDMAYFAGVEENAPATTADWYLTAAQTTDALDTSPAIAYAQITDATSSPAYSGWSASEMMGACNQPPQSAINGFACNRSTDVWGIALDNQGQLLVTWPKASHHNFGCSNGDATCHTYVTRQTDGPTIGPASVSANTPETPWTPLLVAGGLFVAGLALEVRHKRFRKTTI